MPRLHVIGSAGAGKTVLASRIAAALDIPHIELDALFWGENWEKADTENFRQVVKDALSVENWVIDGNYSRVRDIVWARVDTVVWLDYPLALVLWRLFRRTMRRILSRELLWGSNRESFFKQFFTRDSLFFYVLRTHQERRARYAGLSSSPGAAGIKFIHLRFPFQARWWLEEISNSQEEAEGQKSEN